ncbi:putative transporter SVOPL [Dendronephthya gigantea]|uniref:putative transporter SVOPL n=1 Tax=Dendronephthya gigantea TaxID=151771 RepID=UPI00106B5880|nr:putative transporter SVOPL [Dendronephthya gigantea]
MRSDGNNITLSSTLTKRMKMERLWTKFKQFLPTMPLSTAQSSSEQNVESVDDKVKYQLISHADEEATDLNDELFTSRLIDEILDDIGLRLDHWKVFVLLCLVDITCGLGTTILSAILPSLKSDWNISAITAGALTLSIPVGMTLGTMVWGLMSDIYGRKRSIVTSATFILVSALVSAFSTNYYWLWISLFFVGFGATISFQTYVIIAEIFPPRYRSMYSVLTVVFYNLGYLLSAVVSMELSVIGYHWALATVCFPSAIVLIGSIVFLPESPHFYLAAGDEQKALNILHDLAPEMDFSNTILRKHGPEIQRADFTQLFRSGYWKITICACIATCITYLSHGYFIYTASDVAGSSSSGLKNEELLIRHRYTIMVWMTLPGIGLIIAAALCCKVFDARIVLLIITLLTLVSQIIALFVANLSIPLLIVTMISRDLMLSDIALLTTCVSRVYPTEIRSLGTSACVFAGRIGLIFGPFIFETWFSKDHFYGTVFTTVILSVLFYGSCVDAFEKLVTFKDSFHE